MSKENNQVRNALLSKFEKHRIVFWYDDEEQLKSEFDSIELPDVAKVEIENNEFALKYRMLRNEPHQKFLVFKSGGRPEPLDNWLLDVELAHDEFSADQASLWLTELELPADFKQVVKDHEAFFNSIKRRESLRKSVEKRDSATLLRMKMAAVCAGCAASDHRLDSILENLLEELAEEKSERIDLLKRCNLDRFLLEQMKTQYGYQTETASIKDFSIELFKSCYALGLHEDSALDGEALVFLKRWKDSRKHADSFRALSEQYQQILNVQEDLIEREVEDLVDIDYFRMIDIRIITSLVESVLSKSITAGQCKLVTRARKTSFWYSEFENLYEAIENGADFLSQFDAIQINFDSLSQGVDAYTETLFKIDQYYRKFVYHCQQAAKPDLLGQLEELIFNRYSNSFLLQLGDYWQRLVGEQKEWAIPNSTPQRNFYRSHVWKFLQKNKKVYVIVSDALRFEVGEEFCRLIRAENRFEAELSHMITGLPSYTQLGMASLLPNKKITLNDDATASVSVDGQSTAGTPNRDKVLKNELGDQACAIVAKDLLKMNNQQARELVRDHQLVYVFHDVIDQRGHSKGTETQAFSAAEEALSELVKLVTKLTSANATNILVTADHGFIYQPEVKESDYSVAEPKGKQITKKDRRFIIGRNLEPVDGVQHFTAAQLKLDGDHDVLIPKSINRFRLSGSATRFVHGGCLPQEVIVPLIHCRKSKLDDINEVEVDLLPSASQVISSGQASYALYQAEPVSEKLQPRILEIGLWAEGELISDTHLLTFDLTSENPREREQKVKLLLSKESEKFNGKQINLKLRQRIPDTNHFQDYKSYPYTLRRTFFTDF